MFPKLGADFNDLKSCWKIKWELGFKILALNKTICMKNWQLCWQRIGVNPSLLLPEIPAPFLTPISSSGTVPTLSWL